MSKKRAKVISFVGGLVFFSAVVGVLLVKNERIRREVEEQVMSILKTTKSAVGQIQFVVSKAGKISGERKNAKENSIIEQAPIFLGTTDYDAQWSSLEAQE